MAWKFFEIGFINQFENLEITTKKEGGGGWLQRSRRRLKKSMHHFRFDMQRNVSHTWSKTFLKCSTINNVNQKVPFGFVCIWRGIWVFFAYWFPIIFQPYFCLLHKYGKDPIIASRSQSGHDTKHLRSLLQHGTLQLQEERSHSKKGDDDQDSFTLRPSAAVPPKVIVVTTCPMLS